MNPYGALAFFRSKAGGNGRARLIAIVNPYVYYVEVAPGSPRENARCAYIAWSHSLGEWCEVLEEELSLPTAYREFKDSGHLR